MREINVNFPETQKENDVLATLWARTKIDELMMESFKAAETEKSKIKDLIIELGLEYSLLTDYTSFVAVEDSLITENGKPTRVSVPLQSPKGFISSSDPHGFIFQITASRPRNSSDPRNSSAQIDQVANVVDLQLSTTINGQRVVLENSPKPENIWMENNMASNNLPNSGNSSTVLNEILKRMETHRRNLTSLRADVKMTKYDSQLDDSEIFKGSAIYLPSKTQDSMVRIDWTKPSEAIFVIIKGKYILYNPRLQQAIVGNTDSKTSDPLAFLNFSKEKLQTNFNSKYLGEEKLSDQTPVWRLELTPKEGSFYKSVELWIDGNGMPIQVKLIEKNDNYTIIQLSNLRKNATVTASEFKVTLPKETKLVKN